MNMTELEIRPSYRPFLIVTQIAIMTIATARFLWLLPSWLRGVPPAFPGQYEGRLYFAVNILGLGGATLLAACGRATTTRGRLAYRSLLSLAIAALIWQMAADYWAG